MGSNVTLSSPIMNISIQDTSITYTKWQPGGLMVKGSSNIYSGPYSYPLGTSAPPSPQVMWAKALVHVAVFADREADLGATQR